jgi:phosphoribosyl-AMP cyclohydrolase
VSNGPASLKYDGNGLIPAVIQDAETGQVLMVAYMNQTALARTIETGKTHFWSRSRGKYWMKGETSGHVQDVQGIYTDCDADTVLIKVKQHGVACHEGYRSCFFRQLDADGGWKIIAEQEVDPEKVYGKK